MFVFSEASVENSRGFVFCSSQKHPNSRTIASFWSEFGQTLLGCAGLGDFWGSFALHEVVTRAPFTFLLSSGLEIGRQTGVVLSSGTRLIGQRTSALVLRYNFSDFHPDADVFMVTLADAGQCALAEVDLEQVTRLQRLQFFRILRIHDCFFLSIRVWRASPAHRCWWGP